MYKHLIVIVIMSLFSINVIAENYCIKNGEKAPQWVCNSSKFNLLSANGMGKNEKIAYHNAVCEIIDILQPSYGNGDMAISIGKNTTVFRNINFNNDKLYHKCTIKTKLNNQPLTSISDIFSSKTDVDRYYEFPSDFENLKMALSQDGFFMINTYFDNKNVHIQMIFSKEISKQRKNSNDELLWQKFVKTSKNKSKNTKKTLKENK